MTQQGATQGGGWTRVITPTGSYEYQFQGRGPAVRSGQYENAHDYNFLVMDAEGWLYRIPVRVAAEVEEQLQKNRGPEAPALPEQETFRETLPIAEAQLRAGLEKFKPRSGAPYQELDRYFAVDASRANEWKGSG